MAVVGAGGGDNGNFPLHVWAGSRIQKGENFIRPRARVLLDPIEAYEHLAPEFNRVAARRRAYLDRVEQLVVAGIAPGAATMLDVGAGNGARALRIAQQAGITDLTLLEPSATMRAQWPQGVRGWPIRAEELAAQRGAFDVITCLWNVLGHIFPGAARVEVLQQCGRLLSANGRIFTDVSHRYNAAEYGWPSTVGRMLTDRLIPRERNGDVTARWQLGAGEYATRGHVFTQREMRRLAAAAKLKIQNRLSIDYRTGDVQSSVFRGHLFYTLIPAGKIDDE